MRKGKSIKHLLELSLAEKRAFLQSFDMIMSSCDGTIWNLGEPLPGVGAGLKLLRRKGKRLVFISNNGRLTMDEYRQSFQDLGIWAPNLDVVHPALTVVRYLRAIQMRDPVYCIATQVFKDYLRQAGFNVLSGPTGPFPSDDVSDVVQVSANCVTSPNNPRVGAVVIDYDMYACMVHILLARNILRDNPDCQLIAGATDHDIPVDIGGMLQLIGPGYLLDIIERMSGRKALVLGKPGTALSAFVLKQFNIVHPERVLFVGDMLPQDMGFGTKSGFQKLLVLSGGTTYEKLKNHKKTEELPHLYADSIADFVQLYNEVSQ